MKTEKFEKIEDSVNYIKITWRDKYGDDVNKLSAFVSDIVSACENHYLIGVGRQDIAELLMEVAVETILAIEDTDEIPVACQRLREAKRRVEFSIGSLTDNFPEARGN